MERALKFAVVGSAIATVLCAAAREWFATVWAFNAFFGYALAAFYYSETE